MSTTSKAEHSGGRKRTGGLLFKSGQWYGRFTTLQDGEAIRVTRALGTTNKAAARRKLARLVASIAVPTPQDVQRYETVQEACERAHAARKADGLADTENEIGRLRRFAFEELGQLEVTAVTPPHVNAVLDATKAAGKSRGTVQHLKQDLANVFAALKREGVITTNPADEAEMPGFPKVLQKERAVLTDEELAVYLSWSHPDERYQGAALERQVMSCVARCFGGLRTGDLHALTWDRFDAAAGRFEWGWAPRRKTKAPQKLLVPPMLRPILHDYWERKGRPTAGLLFAVRKGKRAGQGRVKGESHAREFRRDLRRAFGIDLPKLEQWERKGRLVTVATAWKASRDLTLRERELFEESETTLPVDFHSWRRAFAQALADAEVNAQTAMALTGHASMAAHQRYLASATKMRAIPMAALPDLSIRISEIQNSEGADHELACFPVSRDRIELSTRGFSVHCSTD